MATQFDIDALTKRIVPGEGAVSLRRLSTGLFNTTYRVVRDGAAYALRILRGEVALLADRHWEIRVLNQAMLSGLAPPLRYAEATSGVLLLDWMAGSTLSEQSARHADTGLQVAKLLRAVHAMPIPEPARLIDPAGWIDAYSAALSVWGLGRALPFAAAAAATLGRLRDLPMASRVVCHSDLHRFNVLRRDVARHAPRNAPGESHALLLLDWEYSHVADAHWDLAGWSANNDLPETAQRDLLRAYWEVSPSQAQWQSFKLQFWLYDYICLLWMELYSRVRPADSAANTARAAWLERRLAASVYGTIIA